jgi:hypothetical protein
MPRYFFHLADGRCHPDEDGLELGSLEDARAEAVKGARDYMADQVRHHGKLPLSDTFEIRDASGELLLRITFRDTVFVH